MNIITFQMVLSRQNVYDFHAPHKIVLLVITIVCRRMWILEMLRGGGFRHKQSVETAFFESGLRGQVYNTETTQLGETLSAFGIKSQLSLI
jgi:hypothetical protein